MIDDVTLRLLTARLAEEQAGHRIPSVAAGLVRDARLVWAEGPYDEADPVPGGVDSGGWR